MAIRTRPPRKRSWLSSTPGWSITATWAKRRRRRRLDPGAVAAERLAAEHLWRSGCRHDPGGPRRASGSPIRRPCRIGRPQICKSVRRGGTGYRRPASEADLPTWRLQPWKRPLCQPSRNRRGFRQGRGAGRSRHRRRSENRYDNAKLIRADRKLLELFASRGQARQAYQASKKRYGL